MSQDSGAARTPRIAHRNLPLLLLKAREAMLAGFRPIITHFGLTEQQWRVMRTLADEPDLEPRQICEAAQILSPSLTGVLARMEELDLVHRTRIPEDQRRVRVRLTARSVEMVGRIAPLIEAQYALVAERLGAPLVADLVAVLDQVLEKNLQTLPAVELPPRAGDEPL